MLKSEFFIQAQLVSMAWRFANAYGGGPIIPQMIMSVFGNRFRAGQGSWLEVLERVPKYMAESELPELKYPSIWEPAFVKTLHSVDGVFEGSAQDLSKGALYFADLNNVQRPWFKEHIIDAVDFSTGLRRHPQVANMNSLSFFGEKE